jgi:hypothetical protein
MSDSVGFVGRRLFAVGLSIGAILMASLFMLVAGFRWWWCSFVGLALVGLVHLFGDHGQILDPYPWVRGFDGEMQVARLLEALEGRGYRLEAHIDVGFGDVDIVVVGPTGVFAIEVKNWSSTVRKLDGKLFRGRADETASLRQAVRGAIAIRERVDIRWAEAILVIPNATVVSAPFVLNTVHVVSGDELIGTITRRPQQLNQDDVGRIFTQLQRLPVTQVGS